MKIIENIHSNCHNTKDDTAVNRCYWRLFKKFSWPKQSAYIYKDSEKIQKQAKKTSLQDLEEFVWL